MFNRYNISISRPTSTTVREFRAPTDESVKILREMETAAKEEVEKSFRLDFNGFNVLMHIHSDYMNDQTVVNYYYDWNGKKVKERVFIDRMESNEKVVAKIIDSLSKSMAREVLYDTNILSNIFKKF